MVYLLGLRWLADWQIRNTVEIVSCFDANRTTAGTRTALGVPMSNIRCLHEPFKAIQIGGWINSRPW